MSNPEETDFFKIFEISEEGMYKFFNDIKNEELYGELNEELNEELKEKERIQIKEKFENKIKEKFKPSLDETKFKMVDGLIDDNKMKIFEDFIDHIFKPYNDEKKEDDELIQEHDRKQLLEKEEKIRLISDKENELKKLNKNKDNIESIHNDIANIYREIASISAFKNHTSIPYKAKILMEKYKDNINELKKKQNQLEKADIILQVMKNLIFDRKRSAEDGLSEAGEKIKGILSNWKKIRKDMKDLQDKININKRKYKKMESMNFEIYQYYDLAIVNLNNNSDAKGGKRKTKRKRSNKKKRKSRRRKR